MMDREASERGRAEAAPKDESMSVYIMTSLHNRPQIVRIRETGEGRQDSNGG